jgi:hypothetical protein
MELDDWLAQQMIARHWHRIRLAHREALAALKPGVGAHDNVARWIESHPGHRAVRGWLIHLDAFRGHSVVDTGVEWLDVTPRVGRYNLRFLWWRGTDAQYWRFPQEVARR